jgi:hypothetical protein
MVTRFLLLQAIWAFIIQEVLYSCHVLSHGADANALF